MTGSLMHTPSLHTLPPPTPRALIADDQPDVLTALRLLLRNAGYQTEAVSSPAEVLEAIRHGQFDLVLMDLNYARDTTSGQEGLDLISNIRRLDSSLPIVVLTADATPDARNVPTALARALGILEASARESLLAVKDYIAQRQLLLCLDNLEHLPDLAPLVEELLAAAPRLKPIRKIRSPSS